MLFGWGSGYGLQYRLAERALLLTLKCQQSFCGGGFATKLQLSTALKCVPIYNRSKKASA